MASGLPDYYRGVDVAYQQLGEMVTRPKYGGAQLKSGSETVIGGGQNPLALIIGKGMIYGGIVWLDYTTTQANSKVQPLLDGEYLNDVSFIRLFDYGVRNPRSSIITINTYNPTDYIYSIGLSYGITFESYFYLIYDEEHGTTPHVHYRLVYALI